MEAAAWAFGANGVALRIPRGVRIAEPVRLELRSHGHGQVVVVVEEGASVALLETHFGDSEGLRNLSVSIVLEDGAELTHVRQAPFARALVAVETISVRVNGNARYRAHLADLGGKLSRIEFNVALDGAGARSGPQRRERIGRRRTCRRHDADRSCGRRYDEPAIVQDGGGRAFARSLSGQDRGA